MKFRGRRRSRGDVRFAPVTFSEHGGVRYLHFGTEWIQGAMRMSRPDRLELLYAQQMMLWMLFIHEPQHILQLGLGAASLTKFCYRHFPHARVTAVDINKEVIAAAHSMFALPPDDDRLSVVAEDAADFVAASPDRAYDVVQVDLYDATARGPVLEDVDFYSECRRLMWGPGVMTVNLFGEHPSFTRNIKAMETAFDGRVLALPPVHEGNRIALAFTGPALSAPVAALIQKARAIQRETGLETTGWLEALLEASGERVDESNIHI